MKWIDPGDLFGMQSVEGSVATVESADATHTLHHCNRAGLYDSKLIMNGTVFFGLDYTLRGIFNSRMIDLGFTIRMIG